MLISVFFGTGRGGSLRLKEERGLLMADALQQEASQKERERDGVGGRRRGQQMAFTSIQ